MPQTSGVRSAARYLASDGGPRVDVLPDYIFSQALVRYGFNHGQALHTLGAARLVDRIDELLR